MNQTNSQSFRLKEVDIIDRNGFERPTKAFSILIPIEWQSSGGIFWKPMSGSLTDALNFDWQAFSPDGNSCVSVVTTETWQVNNTGMPPTGNSLSEPISTVRQYLESFLRRHRPHARILNYSDRPDLTADLQHFNSVTPWANGGELKNWIEGGQVLISYSDRPKAVEETIAVVAKFQLMRMAGVYPGMTTELLSGETNPGFAMKAPTGKLKYKLGEAIRKSAKVNPQWQAAVNQIQQQITQNNIETQQQISQINHNIGQIHLNGAIRRGQIRQQTNDYLSNLNWNSYQNRQAAMERQHQQFSQLTRGVETYHDAVRGEYVELSNLYNNAWRLNDGTYVVTDNADFNPYRDLGIDGDRLHKMS